MCTFSILKIYRQLTTSKSKTNMPLPGKIVKLERRWTHTHRHIKGILWSEVLLGFLSKSQEGDRCWEEWSLHVHNPARLYRIEGSRGMWLIRAHIYSVKRIHVSHRISECHDTTPTPPQKSLEECPSNFMGRRLCRINQEFVGRCDPWIPMVFRLLAGTRIVIVTDSKSGLQKVQTRQIWLGD